MLGWKVEESHEFLTVLLQTQRRLWVFCLIGFDEQIKGLLCILFGLSLPNVVDRSFGFRLGQFGKAVQHIHGLVLPAPLVARCGINLFQRGPEPHGTISDGQRVLHLDSHEKMATAFPFTKRVLGSFQLTLITLAMFILTNSHGLDYVFIDEPENSLHPQWQSKFLSFISTVSRQEDINYQVASHSPVLLTGALTSERKVTVIRCRPDAHEELQHFQQESDDSVEELLWEAFDVITPASRFVAKRISDLLWLLEDGKVSRKKAVLEIEDFIGKSIESVRSSVYE